MMPEKLITRSDYSSMPVLERYRRFEKDQRGFLKLCLDSPKPASGGDQQRSLQRVSRQRLRNVRKAAVSARDPVWCGLRRRLNRFG